MIPMVSPLFCSGASVTTVVLLKELKLRIFVLLKQDPGFAASRERQAEALRQPILHPLPLPRKERTHTPSLYADILIHRITLAQPPTTASHDTPMTDRWRYAAQELSRGP